MAEMGDNSKELDVIDIQLKSLVSEINAKKDDFVLDAEPQSLPLATTTAQSLPLAKPTIGNNIYNATPASVGNEVVVGNNIVGNNIAGVSVNSNISQFGIVPSIHPTQEPAVGVTQQAAINSVGHAGNVKLEVTNNANMVYGNGLVKQGNEGFSGGDNGRERMDIMEDINKGVQADFRSDSDDDDTEEKNMDDKGDNSEVQPKVESNVVPDKSEKGLSVAGFSALNTSGEGTRKSIRQPKKRMIQDYVEYSNTLGEEEEDRVEPPSKTPKVYVDNADDEGAEPPKKGKKGRKAKGKKAAKAKLDVDEVYNSDKEEGEDENDLSKDVMKVGIVKCNKCDRHFMDRKRLRQHQVTVHKPRRATNQDANYHCAECGKVFRRREHWRRHSEVHQMSRPHICITCGKGFKRLEHMKRHQSVHFSDKPFPCDECDKAFTRRDHLAKHKLVHESGGKAKPFAHRKSRRKAESSEVQTKTKSESVKGSKKRKITVQLKARKVEDSRSEQPEDYLDEKDAQSSDFLSSDEESLASPKKRKQTADDTQEEEEGDVSKEDNDLREADNKQEADGKQETDDKQEADVKQETDDTREVNDQQDADGTQEADYKQSAEDTNKTEYTEEAGCIQGVVETQSNNIQKSANEQVESDDSQVVVNNVDIKTVPVDNSAAQDSRAEGTLTPEHEEIIREVNVINRDQVTT